MKEYNINSWVKIQLFKEGIEILKKFFGDDYTPQLDENGYYSMQMWAFISIFGPYIKLGRSCPFDTNILLDEKSIKDHKEGKIK